MSGSVSILLLALLVYSECNSWHFCRQLQWFLLGVISQTLAGLGTNGERKSGSIKHWRKSDVQWKSNDTIFCTKRPLLDCLSFKTLYVVSFSIHTFGPCSAFWKVLSLEKIIIAIDVSSSALGFLLEKGLDVSFTAPWPLHCSTSIPCQPPRWHKVRC